MIFGVVQQNFGEDKRIVHRAKFYKLSFLQSSERSATKKALARQAVKFKNLNGLF